jgi:hypothetical protein
MVSAPGAWKRYFRDCPPQRGDEQSTWTRAQLLKMNARFTQRLERAIARGDERPNSCYRWGLLQLTDTQFAMIAIAATAIAPHARAGDGCNA